MPEELSSCRTFPRTHADNGFYTILIGSLPSGYKPFISAVNPTSGILEPYLLPVQPPKSRQELKTGRK